MEKRKRKIIVIDGYGDIGFPRAVTAEIDHLQMYLEVSYRSVIVIGGGGTSKKMRRKLRKHGCEIIYSTDLIAELESVQQWDTLYRVTRPNRVTRYEFL